MKDTPEQDKRAAAAFWEAQGRRLPLWAPVCLGFGVQCWFLDAPLAAALAAAGLLALAAPVWAMFGRAALIGVLLIGAGYGLTSLRVAAVAAPTLRAPVEALVEGRVRVVDQSQSGRVRLTLDDVTVYGLTPAETPARVRVTLGPRGGDFSPGDRVSAMAGLSPPPGPFEPGGYDFARAAWFQRLGGIGLARGAVLRIEGPQPAFWTALRLGLDGARADLADALRGAMPGEAGAFAAAIVAGDRAALPPDALQALRDSNLAHLLAISGLHMAMVGGLAFGAARLSLAAAQAAGLAPRLRAKRVAAVAALGAAFCYLFLSGAAVATQRAFIMAAAVLGAILADRPALTLRALALAALLLLAATPDSLLGVGFQMSFAATLALVAAYDWARERGWLTPGRGLRRAVLRWVAALVATSVIAGLATAPFAAMAFNRGTSFGLVANLLAVPAMGLVVAPALAAAGALSAVGLQAPALWAAGAGIDWILAVARWTAALPQAAWPVPAAHPAVAWLVTGGGLWLCLWRGRLRLFGAAPLAAALALWIVASPRPDVLVTADGSATGVLTEHGRAVFATARGGFAAEGWIRRDGAREGFEPPSLEGEGPWRTARTPQGWTVAHLNARTLFPGELARRCGPRVLVVAPRVAIPDPPEGCAVIDAGALARHGAASAWLGAGAARIVGAGGWPQRMAAAD